MTSQNLFSTPEAKYSAVRDRNPSAEGSFVYAVKTTGIVCRPTCSARLALFKHVTFFESMQQAINAGFRPCRKCKPEIQLHWNRHRKLVIALIAHFHGLQAAGMTAGDFRLADLAGKSQISKWQLIKIFKRYTGTTPMRYYEELLKGSNAISEQDIPLVVTKKRQMKKEKLGSMSEIECTSPHATETEKVAEFSAHPHGAQNDDWIAEFLRV
ncbi:uncharacterized protein LALA0_S09e02564g [Lachancea lanzarotensis]|uniref:LALA0S09e02564g1_1 n=1 Tax=Lachancea lanzarotensis TaxID=1245769 RepID=A0A0C7NBK8_9SACH|nr:uncharacterized protein LALA0_S09e02564g [Lachancea lanzarotensis]CEP63790.1 LALA0S09e02564g1_1 [Lachancea lanzarotensis]